MGISQTLRRLDARMSRAALEAMKAGLGYPNAGWAPTPSSSGVATTGALVTDDVARTVAAWYAGIRVISEDVASLPLVVYRRNGRSKDRATDHRLYALLHDAPNPEMTSMVFRETLQAHLLTWGNAYAEKEMNASGQVVALWPLRPDRMTVHLDDAGNRAYRYRIRAGDAPVDMPARNVFHIPGLGFDGLIGYSVLRMARETLGQAIALREYASGVLARDARPGTVLEHPGTLSKDAQDHLAERWDKNHGGFTKAGRTAVLEEGMKLHTMEFPPEDILFLASQKWQVTECARWLRLAPHKIGDLERATFSNIEESNIDHVVSTIRTWCVRWEQQMNKDVVPAPMFAEHLVDGLLRGKTLERYMAYAQAIQNKAMVPNEWRALENWNPVEWGDAPVETPNNSAGGVNLPAAINAAGILVRSGFDPQAALTAVGLDPIQHLGLLPVTVQAPESGGPP